MKQTVATLISFPVAALLLSGCLTEEMLTNPSKAGDAEDLRGRLAGLAGVESARLDYTKPVPLDSGKLDLVVRMPADSRPREIVAVVDTAYAGFRESHLHEEGDLDVRFGRHRIHLRTFEPEVSRAKVRAAALRAAEATELGTVEAVINTQEILVAGEPHSTVAILLDDGSTAKDVVPALTSVDRFVHGGPTEGWGVRAADGAELEDDDGLPGELLRSVFGQLSQRELPGAHVVVHAGDYSTYLVDDMQGFVAVDVTAYAPKGAVRTRDWTAYTRAQTALVESADPRILLTVTLDHGTPEPR